MCLERYALLYCGVSVILRGLKKGQQKQNLFLEQNQNIFIVPVDTDACTSSCKIVVASMWPLIMIGITKCNTLKKHPL